MQSLVPTWWVEYAKRRPRIGHPLTRCDYDRIEVAAMDEEAAARAVIHRFQGVQVVAVYMASPTGMA